MTPELCKYVGCFERATWILRLAIGADRGAGLKAKWPLCDDHKDVLADAIRDRGLTPEIQRA